MHAMAMALPKPGYSVARPYCFTVTVPSGEISVFQAGTEELVAEWVATCNYWAARRSRQPLVGGVSNIEYGWTRVLSMDEEDKDDRVSLRSARSNLTRLGAINRVRGQQSQSGNLDKITINDWKPPPHATMPSSLDEEAQLESLCSYVQGLKEELNQHKSIEEPMSRLVSSPVTSSNSSTLPARRMPSRRAKTGQQSRDTSTRRFSSTRRTSRHCTMRSPSVCSDRARRSWSDH